MRSPPFTFKLLILGKIYKSYFIIKIISSVRQADCKPSDRIGFQNIAVKIFPKEHTVFKRHISVAAVLLRN